MLCFLLGGHEIGVPQIKDGRYRLVCRLGCGYQSEGIQTRGMEQREQASKVRSINLLVSRGARTRREHAA